MTELYQLPPLHPERILAALKGIRREADADPAEFGAVHVETFKAALELLLEPSRVIALDDARGCFDDSVDRSAAEMNYFLGFLTGVMTVLTAPTWLPVVAKWFGCTVKIRVSKVDE